MLEKLFGSRLRAKVLSWLLSHPDERFFVRQLESILGLDAPNLSRELARLADMGILTSQKDGRQKYYQADAECPVFPELQGLVLKTIGLGDLLKSALTPFRDRIRVAFIYGSFARGEPHADSDVDLMVVGRVGFRDIVSALAESQRALAREVNPTVYPPEEFRRKAAGDHFVRSVMEKPKLFLIGDEHELAGLAEEPMAGRAPD